MISRTQRVFSFAFLLVALVGCSNEPSTGTLEGKVIYQDKPVTAGDISFIPESGATTKVTINPDGTYLASNLPVGKYKLTISTKSYKNLTPPPPKMGVNAPVPKYVPIPDNYENPESSGLSIDISKGKKTHNIELK